MSLFIASLNSGSNGNCYYIGNENEAILVDAGISCKETERRMQRLGLPMNRVKAIFISHEHIDHIRGLEGLSKKHQLPVYITPKTLQSGRINIEAHLIFPFGGYIKNAFGNLSVTAFPKLHDAVDPHSFIINCNNVTVGVFTDIGICCEHIIHHFKQCHAVFLEANYDEELLQNGRYPYHLKHRIRGGNGHISNSQALEVFIRHKPTFMSHLFLAHLSKDNNCPELALRLFNQHAGHTKIIVASRFQETEVYHIAGSAGKVSSIRARAPQRTQQLSLF